MISNVKKLNTNDLFWKCFEITNDTELTLREFLKVHIHTLNAIDLIYRAWNEVSYRTMNSTWKKLRPECVPDRDLDGFEADSDAARHSHEIIDDSIISDDIVTI